MLDKNLSFRILSYIKEKNVIIVQRNSSRLERRKILQFQRETIWNYLDDTKLKLKFSRDLS